jgi:multidrug efflux pump subunit AcrA (membrane-fusion protein)
LRVVELGPQVGNLRIVESGLEAGERVAVEGLLRLRNGATVIPKVVDLASLDADAGQDEGS